MKGEGVIGRASREGGEWGSFGEKDRMKQAFHVLGNQAPLVTGGVCGDKEGKGLANIGS